MDSDASLPLSPTEWQVMAAIWELKEADAVQVSELLREHFGRSLQPKTVGIFLLRLTQKGHLHFTTPGSVGRGRPAHLYTPAITRREALLHLFMNFITSYRLEPRDFEAVLALLPEQQSSK